MGVPKFFRWMSERYPAISQLIAENRIPEFDCLYLDMNGIIHNCTHKDSDSPTFRMTEDMMFIAIFNYIEHLFGKIKPKKLFFMAVDGVAPRAKMNQQRSRRFRTALDAEKSREKAIQEGQEIPKEPPFDSNCITPGTEFMARLTKQLKYFINKKISEDSDWQDIEVVLSGHEVPGEGEHKIMEYIRLSKAQPGYDPNVRHCLYGLDADLVMLGLLSHDPHFCLLREEVTFGRASKQKSKELEHQNFYLMHLCVVREYLELEFQSIKEPGALSFDFDIERVIDDFILMAFFVGNDFLPNLPHLHINEGALALMFDTYKTVLPKAGGYINQGGEINLQRLEMLLDELSNVEYRWFESENADANWLKSKQTLDTQDFAKKAKKGKLVVSSQQREIYRGIKKWVNHSSGSFDRQPYDLTSTLPARDREFVKTLAESLHVSWETIEDDNGQRHMRLIFPPPPQANDDDGEDEEDEEAQAAVFRVLKQYDNAQVVDVSPEQAQEEMERKYQEKFQAWKNDYYKNKLAWGLDNEEEMRKFTENYVQGLQWVLFYYYRGVVSWPWFFRYHYAPMVSDVKKGLKADMKFKLGQPFRPFQQLMGVLPDRSKTIVPEPYRPLMTNKDSPIIDFYPRDFELDLNGKKMDWEAVVKIPFIDESRLLGAMGAVEDQLTDDERKRNEFGVSLKFSFSRETNFTYPSSWPGVFSDVKNCRCVENIFELPTMDGLEVHVGLTEGAKLGKAALAGFPSLHTLPFVGALAYHGVTVFQQESRNQSMVITLLSSDEETKVANAKSKLGKVVHVGYPFLQEGKITKVSDELFDYLLPRHPSEPPLQVPHGAREISDWKRKADHIESFYSKRLGTEIGTVESLVHVDILKGLRKTDRGDVVKEYAVVPGVETDYAVQTIVDEVMSQDSRFLEKAALPIEEEFPIGTRAFFLGEMAFGRPVEVIGHAGDRLDAWVATSKGPEENWARHIVIGQERYNVYTPSFAVAKMLHLNPLALSKLTSSLSVTSNGLRLNLGLNLKFEAKKLKVLGYSRRNETGWEFSQKSIALIQEYMVQFPEFIAGLQRNPKGDGYNDTDFYPEDVATQKMKEIGQWLKSMEAKSFEKVPLDAEQLDSDVVKLIEEEMNRQAAIAGPLKTHKIRAVPRHGLLKPADAEHRLGGQKFVVGDRVVYVQDSGKVPLGLSGTVIGITRTSRNILLDVVMDATFMSGSSLGERCSPFRGATVEALTVLNLTNRQVVADTRASSARQSHLPSSKDYYVNGYGAPTGPNGQGQLFDARAPTFNPWAKNEQQARTGGQQDGQQQQRGGGRGGRGGRQPNTRGNLSVNQSQAAITLPIRESGPYSTNGNARGHYHQSNENYPTPRGGRAKHQNQNRHGFTIIDQSNPTEGVVKYNPNFKPQNYSFVPPPATLNSSARGGRGNGNRGRGGSTRGGNSASGADGNTKNAPNQKNSNGHGGARGGRASTTHANRGGGGGGGGRGGSSTNANASANNTGNIKTSKTPAATAAAPAVEST